jgi:hypothetical protein
MSVTEKGVTYLVSADLLKRIKQCAKYAGMRWESIACRPSTADAFCRLVEYDMNRKKANL